MRNLSQHTCTLVSLFVSEASTQSNNTSTIRAISRDVYDETFNGLVVYDIDGRTSGHNNQKLRGTYSNNLLAEEGMDTTILFPSFQYKTITHPIHTCMFDNREIESQDSIIDFEPNRKD